MRKKKQQIKHITYRGTMTPKRQWHIIKEKNNNLELNREEKLSSKYMQNKDLFTWTKVREFTFRPPVLQEMLKEKI